MAGDSSDNSSTVGSLVGARVRVAGNLATVRWGPGPLTKEPASQAADPSGGYATPAAPVTVVGIEYDEAGYGKHDGTHQGARIFECPPGMGSFVKVEKVELAVSMQRALAEKYFAAMLPDAASKASRSEVVDSLGYTDSKGKEREMNVEVLGRYEIEQRQKRLEGFMEMSLAESNLAFRYPDNVWEGDWSLPNLRSLWLDKTLLSEWSEIAAICELCPHLEWLSIVRTRLAPLQMRPRGAPLPLPRAAPDMSGGARLCLAAYKCKVRTLVLNSTMVSWRDLLALDASGTFPCLEHLHLANNRLVEGVPAMRPLLESMEGKVDSAAGAEMPFPHMKSLVLDGNGISDWLVISRAIDAFPNLEALHINGNRLGENIDGLGDLAKDQRDRKLTTLCLNENCLGSWAAIGAISGYALLELKIQRNPLTEGDKAVASPQLLRQVLIATMPLLVRLNASIITAKERIASERYFLGIAAQEKNSVIAALAATSNIDAHVLRLRDIHGVVVGGDVTEEAQASRSALCNAIVEVTIRPIGASILDQPQVTKKLPHTMTVGELKRLSQKQFKKISLDRIKLYLGDPGMPFGVPFDDENRELGFYGVGDGAEIRVDEIEDFKKAS